MADAGKLTRAAAALHAARELDCYHSPFREDPECVRWARIALEAADDPVWVSVLPSMRGFGRALRREAGK